MDCLEALSVLERYLVLAGTPGNSGVPFLPLRLERLVSKSS